ncbi:glycosyl hydrolase [Arsenicibacter rosenii]|uniref:Beta-mannosidase-like galactose-binding domain-containing protein n=1 Tax=Arsenicibacter rosenii TaxID=1750698 RepID=A0A1S2VB65_9BACT|nr:glycosyl hydrolase [Arsenicibacter rosenii]OIN55943.1 hypothetical protein BLX24_27270 [Arsenicibacter rosenii]
MKSPVFLLGLGVVCAILAFRTPWSRPHAVPGSDLRAGFKNPPVHARPKVYWWWLNGYVDTVRLKQELRAIKEAGLGGVDIFEIGLPPASDPNQIIPAGPAFMSDASVKTIGMAIREAGKLGLDVGLNLASSWNAGGTWVKPEHAAKTIYVSKTTVRGGENHTLTLPFPVITPDRQGNKRPIQYGPDGRPAWYEEIAVVAFPAGAKGTLDTAQVVNLSARFNPKTGALTWQAPAGNWEVCRYICANSGEQLIRPTPHSAGPIIDHFDSSATRMHVLYFIDRLRPIVGDFTGSPLKNLYLASYEAKEFTWTPTLPVAFRKLHGYDLYKFLPAVFNREWYKPGLAAAFQTDIDKAFSELMINNHYRKAKEICNRYGLQIISESGGPGHLHHIPVETLKALGALDVPRGENWYNRTFFLENDKDSLVDMIFLVKEIAAASHIYKRGIVEQESFTSYWDWQEGPADLKPLADRAFCEGMNRLVIHGFAHNPAGMGYPGIAYFAGTHYNDRNGWWPKSKPFNDYLSRISYILQKTDFVADVLHYYGDGVPNLVPPKNTRYVVGPGYDYEVINTDVLLRDLTVKDGKWVLPGVGSYHVLDLGKGGRIPDAVREKIRKLMAAGGRVTEGEPVLKVLTTMGIRPDFSYAGQKADQRYTPIDHIHYRNAGQDFYLIRNTTNQWITQPCYFRQTAETAEFWDPVTGGITAMAGQQQADGLAQLRVTLPPYGSGFVVFGKGPATATSQAAIRMVAGPDSKLLQSVAGPWQVTFPKDHGAPAAVTLPALMSWTASENEGVKYFSGMATYRKAFNWRPAARPGKGQRIWLDLGRVAKVGEVWLNNKPCGIVWTAPYRVDITDALKTGENVLTVEVANTWSNRLTGDGITGKTYTKTNITKANKNLVAWKDLPLIESGLLGPVTIQTTR